MSALTPDILAKAQAVANEVDHEDHDEAVRVALEAVADLIAAEAWDEGSDWTNDSGMYARDDNPYRSKP